MNDLKINESMFESIKHIDEEGNEYWSARELQKVLEYKEWIKFNGSIDKAKITCINSNSDVSINFVGVAKIVKTGVATKKVFKLLIFVEIIYIIKCSLWVI